MKINNLDQHSDSKLIHVNLFFNNLVGMCFKNLNPSREAHLGVSVSHSCSRYSSYFLVLTVLV